jgi:hypothetical protein
MLMTRFLRAQLGTNTNISKCILIAVTDTSSFDALFRSSLSLFAMRIFVSLFFLFSAEF